MIFIGLLVSFWNEDHRADQVADQTKWHKCATPRLVARKFGNIGQTYRRRNKEGLWIYEDENKIPFEDIAPESITEEMRRAHAAVETKAAIHSTRAARKHLTLVD